MNAAYRARIYYNNLRCWNIRLDRSLIPPLCSKVSWRETEQVCTDLQKYRISFIRDEIHSENQNLLKPSAQTKTELHLFKNRLLFGFFKSPLQEKK